MSGGWCTCLLLKKRERERKRERKVGIATRVEEIRERKSGWRKEEKWTEMSECV